VAEQGRETEAGRGREVAALCGRLIEEITSLSRMYQEHFLVGFGIKDPRVYLAQILERTERTE